MSSSLPPSPMAGSISRFRACLEPFTSWPESIRTDTIYAIASHRFGQPPNEAPECRAGQIHDRGCWVQGAAAALVIPLIDELRKELERTPRHGFTIVTRADGSARTDVDVRAELQAFTLELGAKTGRTGCARTR